LGIFIRPLTRKTGEPKCWRVEVIKQSEEHAYSTVKKEQKERKKGEDTLYQVL
jgi:hypothetical protein